VRPVAIDPRKTDVSDEYIVVYAMDGGDGKPETVEGQYTIYDSRPGDPGHSPHWRHNYVIVPRDYQPQTLRSKEDVLGNFKRHGAPALTPLSTRDKNPACAGRCWSS
jgi:hypothetical protein